MIDASGYPKITDFGLAKEGVSMSDTTKTVCGTPEYIAPEIILRQGHGHSADWWSLGCIIYEMLICLPPFYVEDRREIYKRIIQQRVKYPSGINPVAVDLISKLLEKDPRQRLGYSGGDEIMAHPWFNDINWEDLYDKRIQPPFVPNINNPMDPVYLSDDFTKCPIGESPNFEGSPGCSQSFRGFSYSGSTDKHIMELDI